ncbi:MAG: HEAT repeat domain-containing protein, partial [Sandaracinaceae bacterium]|nr:HEAT repeat domain-containing protein [Sandaracinaceae bacterium]
AEISPKSHESSPAINQNPPPPHPSTPSSLEALPSIIVDMGEEVRSIVEEVIRSAPSSTEVVNRALQRGEIVLPVLLQSFPGPLWYDFRHFDPEHPPRAWEVSAACRVLAAFKEKAVPYVASLLGDTERQRYLPALILAYEVAPYAHTSSHFVSKLITHALSDDSLARTLALRALGCLDGAPALVSQLPELHQAAKKRGKNPLHRLRAIEAIAVVRDVSALNLLIQLLEAEDPAVRDTARQALVVITATDFGTEKEAWEEWVRNHAHLHRIEWLIEALNSPIERIRTYAGKELLSITQQSFDYHPRASRREREAVQNKYRKWWESTGRKLFERRS